MTSWKRRKNVSSQRYNILSDSDNNGYLLYIVYIDNVIYLTYWKLGSEYFCKLADDYKNDKLARRHSKSCKKNEKSWKVSQWDTMQV